jgi:predicted nucleic acid-binding protein
LRTAIVADTGGLLRALARNPAGDAQWPDYEETLRAASRVLVPSAILAEVDYFLRKDRPAMRKLVFEIFDPATTYRYEPVTPADIARALQLDAKFASLELGLVDCSVATVAERTGVHRILTSDRRHFAALRVGARLDRALRLVP